jgi:primosomal protein N'
MIVHVSILRRITVRFDFFDYDHDEALPLGALVEVSYRNKKELGIVVGNSKTSPIKTKPISAVITKQFVSPTTISIAQHIATTYHVSLSNALLLFLPPLPKKNRESFANVEIIEKRKNPKTEVVAYHQDTDLLTHSEFLTKQKGSHLIIVPTQQHHQKLHNIPYTPNTTPKEQKAAYLYALNSEGLTIGTRSALFLPWKNLQSITILDEEHEGHKSWESNPRYDSLQVALTIQAVVGCDIFVYSNFPKTETLYHAAVTHRRETPVTKENTTRLLTTTKSKIPPQIQEVLEENSQLIVYITPKTEKISCMICNDCKTSIKCYDCGNSLATQRDHLFCKKCNQYFELGISCSTCGGDSFYEVGRGAEGVFHALQKEYPAQQISLYTAQDKNEIPQQGVVIGTKTLLEKLGARKIGALIIEDLDMLLTIPDYRSFDTVGNIIARAQELAAKNGAPLLIISNTKENEQLSRIVGQKYGAYYKEELSLRKKLNLPPYRIFVSIEGQTLEKYIPSLPYLQSSTHNKALLCIPHNEVTKTLQQIHATLDEQCIVDVNPLRLLE